jgi:anti-anti-sigma regulatory factor
MPTPHPATTCVIKLSASLIGATGAACTEVVTTKASAAKAINLIIRASHVFKKRFS